MESAEYKTPEELKAYTKMVSSELKKMIKRVKKKKPGDLDKVVHALHIDLFKNFNCLECANCCKTLGPRLLNKDIDRMARHLKLKPSEFMDQYVTTDNDNDYVFAQNPCPFLLPDNYCMIYEHRPKACREYPHTNRNRFVQIMDLSLTNCETCPVVLKIFLQLNKDK